MALRPVCRSPLFIRFPCGSQGASGRYAPLIDENGGIRSKDYPALTHPGTGQLGNYFETVMDAWMKRALPTVLRTFDIPAVLITG